MLAHTQRVQGVAYCKSLNAHNACQRQLFIQQSMEMWEYSRGRGELMIFPYSQGRKDSSRCSKGK